MGRRIAKEMERLINEKKKEFISCKVNLSDLEATKLLAKDLFEFKKNNKEKKFKW